MLFLQACHKRAWAAVEFSLIINNDIQADTMWWGWGKTMDRQMDDNQVKRARAPEYFSIAFCNVAPSSTFKHLELVVLKQWTALPTGTI